MAAEHDSPYYCISQDHCRLCRFRLDDGEVVVAAVNDRAISPEFTFYRNSSFQDNDIFDIRFHMCCRKTCRSRNREVPCFHSECYNFRLYTISPKFLATTAYSFQATMLEERRRRDRILHILTARLRDSWSKRLPYEICGMIAGHLVRECAVITAQELPDEEASESVIDFSHDVHARHVVIEGIRYIRCLRNSAQSTPEVGETLLLKGQSSGDFGNVYIGEDHLGIRQIELFSSSKPCVRTAGLWWRQLSESCCDSTFRTKTDGLKLRDLLPSQEQSEIASAHTYWAIPAPPVSIFDIVSLKAPLNQPNGLRMSFFDCNAAHTTGYSVAVDGVSIATIRAHGQDMDLTFYEEFKVFTGRPMVWIYMPIDEGEYVTEICRRFGFWHGQDCSGLMFTTNQQRTTLFECYMPPPSSDSDYQFGRIYAPPATPSRIYFNEWDSTSTRSYVQYLGVESTQTPISRPYPKSLVPLSSCPDKTSIGAWYYSFCSMEDVIHITLCIDKTASHKPIVGMLLNYRDNHRVCVGQFRFNWLLKTIEVAQATEMHIGMKMTTENRFPYVADINMHGPVDGDFTSWLEVSWKGTLEWSFSHCQCKLHYTSSQDHY